MTHYFINDANLKSNIKKINVSILNNNYTFNTDNGIFSKEKIDFGSNLLIENLPIDKMNGKILDLGCGYGPIGIIIANNTKSYVDMIDINLRAIHLSRMNIKENKISNAQVYESNMYEEIKEKYNYIITNPPIRAGKKVLYEIIFDAEKHLKKDGELWFVIRKDQGAKSLLKDMEKSYITQIINKKNGFFIISAKIR